MFSEPIKVNQSSLPNNDSNNNKSSDHHGYVCSNYSEQSAFSSFNTDGHHGNNSHSEFQSARKSIKHEEEVFISESSDSRKNEQASELVRISSQDSNNGPLKNGLTTRENDIQGAEDSQQPAFNSPLPQDIVPQSLNTHSLPIVEKEKVGRSGFSEHAIRTPSKEGNRKDDSHINSGRRNKSESHSGGLSAAFKPKNNPSSSNESIKTKTDFVISESSSSSSHRETISKQNISTNFSSKHSKLPVSFNSSSNTNSGRKLKAAAVNANHLLNFQYQPIQRGHSRGSNYHRRQKKTPPQPFNKELFLQANFRFLVSDLGDYLLNLADPDRMIDWADVLLVEVSSSTSPQCPICLENALLCPQITSCGHLFCFPCILQYLMQGSNGGGSSNSNKGMKAGEDHHWKKCPLCFSTISTKDLRSATVHCITPPTVGNSLQFTLLMRSKSCILPYERSIISHPSLLNSTTLPFSSTGRCHPFSKFTLTGEQGARAAEAMAANELTAYAQSVERKGGDDLLQLPYVFSAMDFLRERTRTWIEHRESDFISFSPPLQKRILSISKITSSGIYIHDGDDEDNADGEMEDQEIIPSLSPSSFPSPSPSSIQQNDTIDDAKSKKKEKKVVSNDEVDVSEVTSKAMSKLKKDSSWVYEDAFSDEEKGLEKEKGKDKESNPFKGIRSREDMDFHSLSLNDNDDDDDVLMELDEVYMEEADKITFLPSSGIKPSPSASASSSPSPAAKEGKVGKEKGEGGGSEERCYFMFYQASDGQLCMIHPMSMRCLVHHYGSYESLPNSIEGRVLELENVVQSDVSRRRYRYLCHLPLTSHFLLCELDLSSILPPSSLAPFTEEFRSRQQKRLNRAKQEAEENARAEREASRFHGPKPPSPQDFAAILELVNKTNPVIQTSNIDSEYPLPIHSSSPTNLASPFSASSTVIFPLSSSPSSSGGHSATSSSSRLLFSKVTKLGYASGHDAPDLRFGKFPGPVTISKPTPQKGSWGSPLNFDAKADAAATRLGLDLPSSGFGLGSGLDLGLDSGSGLASVSDWGSSSRPRSSPNPNSALGNSGLVKTKEDSTTAQSTSKGKKSKKGTMLFSTSSGRRY